MKHILQNPDRSEINTSETRRRLLPVLAGKYLEHLRVRNYSPQTIQSQSKQLRFFQRFSKSRGIVGLDQVTRQLVLDYQAHVFHQRKRRDGAPLAISTQRQWLTAVVSFMAWATRQSLIPFSPASDLEMPRQEHRLPKAVLVPAEIERILRLPDIRTPLGLRDRAIIETFYSTGIRRTELCNLDIADVDFARGVVRVEQGKGRKDRYVPIGERALMWIEQYLVKARPALGKIAEATALFLGAHGRRVHPDRLGQRIHAMIEQARLGKNGSCHLFRHAFATALLENGCDLRHIQAMMGHAKLETTAIYIHLNMHDLKVAHDRFHPARLTHKDKRRAGLAIPDRAQLNFDFMRQL